MRWRTTVEHTASAAKKQLNGITGSYCAWFLRSLLSNNQLTYVIGSQRDVARVTRLLKGTGTQNNIKYQAQCRISLLHFQEFMNNGLHFALLLTWVDLYLGRGIFRKTARLYCLARIIPVTRRPQVDRIFRLSSVAMEELKSIHYRPRRPCRISLETLCD